MNLTPHYTVILDDKTEPGKHWYAIEGVPGCEKLPGTTTPLEVIAKPALITWARNMALDHVIAERNRAADAGWDGIPFETLDRWIATARKRPDKERDDAADLGTKVHGFIDRFIKSEGGVSPLDVPKEARPAVAAFLDWWQKQDLEFLLGDTRVASIKHRVGGSLDALARRKSDGKILLLDWKTSNRTYDTHALQAGGGYHFQLEETYGLWADEAWVVRFSKKLPVTFAPHQVADIPRARETYLLALNLWRALKDPFFVPHRKGKPKTVKETA